MSDTMKGSCKCGLIRFTLNPEKHSVVNCHCHDCRKLNGGAFSTYVAVADGHFRLVEGQDKLTRYVVSEKVTKHFCGVCGTPIFNQSTVYPGLTIVPLGALDDTGDFRPGVNIFCDSKLSWVVLPGDTKDFPRGMDT